MIVNEQHRNGHRHSGEYKSEHESGQRDVLAGSTAIGEDHGRQGRRGRQPRARDCYRVQQFSAELVDNKCENGLHDVSMDYSMMVDDCSHEKLEITKQKVSNEGQGDSGCHHQGDSMPIPSSGQPGLGVEQGSGVQYRGQGQQAYGSGYYMPEYHQLSLKQYYRIKKMHQQRFHERMGPTYGPYIYIRESQISPPERACISPRKSLKKNMHNGRLLTRQPFSKPRFREKTPAKTRYQQKLDLSIEKRPRNGAATGENEMDTTIGLIPRLDVKLEAEEELQQNKTVQERGQWQKQMLESQKSHDRRPKYDEFKNVLKMDTTPDEMPKVQQVEQAKGAYQKAQKLSPDSPNSSKSPIKAKPKSEASLTEPIPQPQPAQTSTLSNYQLQLIYQNAREFIIHSLVYKGDKIKTKMREPFTKDPLFHIFQRKVDLPPPGQGQVSGWLFCRAQAREKLKMVTVSSKCAACLTKCEGELDIDRCFACICKQCGMHIYVEIKDSKAIPLTIEEQATLILISNK